MRPRQAALSYGEFALPFFFQLLALARPVAGERFCDVGSGCGRLVLAAALAHRWKGACGVEMLSELHALALEAQERLSSLLGEDTAM